MNHDDAHSFRATALARLDAISAEVAALRGLFAEPVASADVEGAEVEPLLEVADVAERLGYPADTVRSWCRKGCGRKIGGRWYASPSACQRRARGE